MIDVRYPVKLMYRKYAFNAKIDVILPPNTRFSTISRKDREIALIEIRKWLADHCTDEYRTNTTWNRTLSKDRANFVHVCHFSAFFKERIDFDGFVDQYRERLTATTLPINKEHEDLLRSGTNVEIRQKLFYNKFRYRVNFKGGWGGGYARRHITETVYSHVHDESKHKQDYLLTIRDCTLYLEHLHDLMAIKLSIGDLITRLTMVNTFEEAGIPG